MEAFKYLKTSKQHPFELPGKRGINQGPQRGHVSLSPAAEHPRPQGPPLPASTQPKRQLGGVLFFGFGGAGRDVASCFFPGFVVVFQCFIVVFHLTMVTKGKESQHPEASQEVLCPCRWGVSFYRAGIMPHAYRDLHRRS